MEDVGDLLKNPKVAPPCHAAAKEERGTHFTGGQHYGQAIGPSLNEQLQVLRLCTVNST